MTKIIDFIHGNVNYALKGADHIIKKIASNPSALKKVYQIVNKTFTAIDLYYERKVNRPMSAKMKGSIGLIELYGTYKNLMYWINPFSKGSLDQKLLKQSIEDSLCLSHTDPHDIDKRKQVVHQVFDQVIKKEDFDSKGEVLDEIRIVLENVGYETSKAQSLANRVIVQQKERSVIELLYMASFTIADIGGNILTLKEWGSIDLSFIAASIGTQSRVFVFVAKVGAETVIGVIASAGIILVVGKASYDVITNLIERYHYAKTDDEKAKVAEALRHAWLDFFSGTTDLVYTLTPLLFTLNPPVVVTLALVAKGTGLVCILLR